jgi:hypothetical protein
MKNPQAEACGSFVPLQPLRLQNAGVAATKLARLATIGLPKPVV